MALVFAAVCVATVSGCGGSGDSGGSSSSKYAVGIDSAFSGPLSAYGTTIADGIRAWASGVNAEGGINGHEIEVVQLDSEEEPTRSAAVLQQLITSNDALAVFGFVVSDNCSAASTIAGKEETPILCLNAPQANLEPPQKMLFMMGDPAYTGAEAQLKFAQEAGGSDSTKVAISATDASGDKEWVEKLEELAPKVGVEIVDAEQSPVDAVDMSAPAAKIAASHPDIVLAYLTEPAQLSLYKNLTANGFDGPLNNVNGNTSYGSLLQVDQPTFTNAVPYEYVDPASKEPAVQEYVKAFKAAGIEGEAELNKGVRESAYLGGKAVGAALEACGDTCTGADVAANLEKIDLSLPGLRDKLAYTPDSHVSAQTWTMYGIKRGKPTILGSGLPGND